MAQMPPVFNSGLELASSIVDSELLHQSWSSIWSLYAEANPLSSSSANFKVFKQPNLTVIAFVTSPIYSPQHLLQQQQEGGPDLVSSESLKQHNFPHLDFLCSPGNPSFSFHKHAVSGFASLFTSLQASATQLLVSKDGETVLESPVLVTGHSLGGSIASLFTLWLLDSLSQLPSKKPSKKLPILCITFGSPLIGDKGVHGGISQRSTWNSYFLHVVSSQDPLPTLLLASSPLLRNAQLRYYYKPFGTFLLTSELGCACVEDPDVVSLLLSHKAVEFEGSNVVSLEGLPVQHYGLMVEHLKIRALCQGSSQLGGEIDDSLHAGMVLLLEAIGITRDQLLQQQSIINLAEKTKQRLLLLMRSKRNAMEPNRKLNEIKIKVVLIGRYKQECSKKGVGYYDSYKNQWSTADIDIARHKKHLTNYWKEMVEEAQKKPQKEGSHVRVSWLYGGTTYRRMVEPLDIADFYRGNGSKRDYKNQGRAKHYILLEKWLQEDNARASAAAAAKPGSSSMKINKKNRAGNFTEDSCFWANVEEARISCRLLKAATTGEGERRLSESYLLQFEEYVMEMIRNNAVDPEIFLGKSSFMKWWAEFQEIVGKNHSSSLAGFMRNGLYHRYGSEHDNIL